MKYLHLTNFVYSASANGIGSVNYGNLAHLPVFNTKPIFTILSRGVVGLNLVLSDKVFFSVDSGSLGHA